MPYITRAEGSGLLVSSGLGVVRFRAQALGTIAHGEEFRRSKREAKGRNQRNQGQKRTWYLKQPSICALPIFLRNPAHGPQSRAITFYTLLAPYRNVVNTC